ncbi:MAG: hypothetical protein IKO27_00815 [Ruminococcus sp.]|nr:hypothetical protein [Ruminococcus sp.]
MTDTAKYIPKDEDFVPAPMELRETVKSESVRGAKGDMRRRFFAQKSAVAELSYWPC